MQRGAVHVQSCDDAFMRAQHWIEHELHAMREDASPIDTLEHDLASMCGEYLMQLARAVCTEMTNSTATAVLDHTEAETQIRSVAAVDANATGPAFSRWFMPVVDNLKEANRAVLRELQWDVPQLRPQRTRAIATFTREIAHAFADMLSNPYLAWEWHAEHDETDEIAEWARHMGLYERGFAMLYGLGDAKDETDESLVLAPMFEWMVRQIAGNLYNVFHSTDWRRLYAHVQDEFDEWQPRDGPDDVVSHVNESRQQELRFELSDEEDDGNDGFYFEPEPWLDTHAPKGGTRDLRTLMFDTPSERAQREGDDDEPGMHRAYERLLYDRDADTDMRAAHWRKAVNFRMFMRIRKHVLARMERVLPDIVEQVYENTSAWLTGAMLYSNALALYPREVLLEAERVPVSRVLDDVD